MVKGYYQKSPNNLGNQPHNATGQGEFDEHVSPDHPDNKIIGNGKALTRS